MTMGRLNQQLNPTQTGTEAERLDGDLRKRIVGQDEAIEQIISVYQTHLAGMSSPGRPIGNLLFLGPTGSGKTRLLEAPAESLGVDPAPESWFRGRRYRAQPRRGHCGRVSRRQGDAGRHRSGAAEVFAGIHEPARQDCGIPPARRGRVAKNSHYRTECGAAADL